MVLTNGISSPVFKGRYENDQDMQEFDIQDYSLVKRVNGTTKSDDNYPLDKLSFGNKDGSEITNVDLYNESPYGGEFELHDDEEIIGIYGTYKKFSIISQLGFIVWKPPHF